MNFFKNLGNKLPSIKNNKNKKKLTQKEFSTITKIIDEERKRRKKRYQEMERRKIKMGKQNKPRKRANNRDKICPRKSYSFSCTESKDNSPSTITAPPNPILQLCKERVFETKVENSGTKNIPENDASHGNKISSSSSRDKKHMVISNEKLDNNCFMPTFAKSIPTEELGNESSRNATSPINNEQKRLLKKPIRELLRDKSLQLTLKLPSGDVKKKKKNFDSIGSCQTAPSCKTIDIIHPYAASNIKYEVYNSKLSYLHRENNNNNWNIYDPIGVPFWVPKLDNDEDHTDDTTPDTIPLDSTSLIDVEQGKLELPECIEEPTDLNPFQPLRVMINRNKKYFENKTLCLITLRSMAALHLKDLPSKTDPSTFQSIRTPIVEITNVREFICYPKWVPKTVFKCKYTGEVWPIKVSNGDDQSQNNGNNNN